MTHTVLKVFGTGQVTIPKKWRKKYNTNLFLAHEEDDKIILQPAASSPQAPISKKTSTKEYLKNLHITAFDNTTGKKYTKTTRKQFMDRIL
ncbi:MAG: AbrB/MazE/SpoVT family DNA-binding domain-containing protein [bacterium]